MSSKYISELTSTTTCDISADFIVDQVTGTGRISYQNLANKLSSDFNNNLSAISSTYSSCIKVDKGIVVKTTSNLSDTTLYMCGGTNQNSGATLLLYNNAYKTTSDQGSFRLATGLSGSSMWQTPALVGTNNGKLQWNKQNVVRTIDNLSADLSGNITINSLVSAFINAIYPVGSIYTSILSSFDPNVTFGGTWEKIASGKCLWGATNKYPVSTDISAGLPTHTHTVSVRGIGSSYTTTITTASTGGYQGSMPAILTATTESISPTTIYSKSTTVQPPAVAVNFWQRIA